MGKKEKEFSIFDILKAIVDTKEDLTNHKDFDKIYNQFMVNRWLSGSLKSLYSAYFANQITSKMDNKTHFYFVQSIAMSTDGEETYFGYPKGTKREDVDIIMEYYNLSEEKAVEINKILTNDQINTIRESIGGRIRQKKK